MVKYNLIGFNFFCISKYILLQIHLRQFMGTRYSAIDAQFMTEEDKIACGMLTVKPATSSSGTSFDSFLGSNDEVVDLQTGSQ
jgi:hypothetical protein